MSLTTAVLVDDRADQCQLFARVLSRAGWHAHTAANSVEGETLAARILAGPDAAHTVILTDLHMRADPYAATSPWLAGAYFALRLRARMQSGDLPRAPIVGMSSLLSLEMRLAGVALGCDAVLEKDPPIDLAARVTAALAQAEHADGLFGLDALLPLAGLESRHRIATVADLNAALLAYRRDDVVRLGETTLARALAPELVGVLQRGEATYARIMRCLEAFERLGALETAASLPGELASYYRLRIEAAQALLDLLASQGDLPPLERASML